MIKMIATDMDGTLLDERGEFDRLRLERILDQLDQRHIRFVVATGNEIHRMRLLFGDLVERVTFVVANGARIFHQNEMILGKFWQEDLVAEALAYFQGCEREVHLVVTALNGGFVQTGTLFPMIDKVMTEEMAEAFYRRMNFRDQLRLEDFPQVLKMSLMVAEDQAAQVTKAINRDFAGRLHAVTSGFGAIDIIQTGIHKAWGMEQLMDKWGIEAQEVVAFGDSENDLEMLDLAGISYVMDNAEPAIKTYASHIAPANSQAGVLSVLERYIEKGEWYGS